MHGHMNFKYELASAHQILLRMASKRGGIKARYLAWHLFKAMAEHYEEPQSG